MGDPRDTTVLIPAAGRVPEGLLSLASVSTPAMIPVAGRPVVYWTLQHLTSLGYRRFVVAVPSRGLFIEEFVEASFGGRCEVAFTVPPPGGVGDTLLHLAGLVGTRGALVVLGDTYFRFADPADAVRDEPLVLTSPVEESFRWCVAESGADGVLHELHDKVPGRAGRQDALIGVYQFPDAALLREAAAAAVETARANGGRTELKPILEAVHRRTPIRVRPAGEWLDCGNPDGQAASHRSLLQARSFNELAIDPVFGTVTKRSRNKEKFLDEIDYLRLLPNSLAVLFPRVLGFGTDWDDPWLQLEFYGYPTLSEVFVFENLDPGLWERIFRHVLELQTRGFMGHERPLRPGAVRRMYYEKTRERCDSVPTGSALGGLLAKREVRLNGRPVRGLPALWDLLEAEVAKLEANVRGTIVHGDLCLSNVLYDLRARVCKFIDPRGAFGDRGPYGDPRYDAAKLYHSVYGLYDLIVNDVFSVGLSGDDVTLDLRARPQHRDVCRRFEAVYFESFDRREVLLVTALLFASMPALHAEAPKRQLAMYARALELFDEYFEGAVAP